MTCCLFPRSLIIGCDVFPVTLRQGNYCSQLKLQPLATSYCEEDDAGGLHGVLRRKDNATVVNAAIEIGVRGPTYGEVPFK